MDEAKITIDGYRDGVRTPFEYCGRFSCGTMMLYPVLTIAQKDVFAHLNGRRYHPRGEWHS